MREKLFCHNFFLICKDFTTIYIRAITKHFQHVFVIILATIHLVTYVSTLGPSINDVNLGGGGICQQVTLLHKPIYQNGGRWVGRGQKSQKMDDIIYGWPLFIKSYFLYHQRNQKLVFYLV